MEDFTRNFNLRALSVSDFVKVENNKYELPENFELEGKLVVERMEGKNWYSYYLEYTFDDDAIFTQFEDSFEEVLEVFNDWRMNIYADLLLLPDDETVSIEMRKGDKELETRCKKENLIVFRPLISKLEARIKELQEQQFTKYELQFIKNRLDECIEEWDVPDMVFMAHQILKKIERTLKNSEGNLNNEQ